MTTASKPPVARRKTLVGDHPTCSSASMDESYESGDVIGTGSFGIIRKVTRRADGAILARKELNYGRMDERDLKQLTEEVNILEQLGSNDNIVRYYERFVDKSSNMLYILMEYCEGGDLAQVIQRCRQTKTYLSEDIVWGYLTQITLALHDCHSEADFQGRRKPIILHRDIKPENVFLDRDNNLKLGDFGLSKAMAQAAMTQTYVGTPYYMSPELINGQPYDIKSDIWALGCLIYELCAGHPPFHEARTQPELAVLIREGRIPDLPKAYTSHLGQVIRAMLKQNPKHRPNTAQIKALDNVKLQVRALELRKATRDLRQRDQRIAEREKELLSREAAVLQREKSLVARESALALATAALKREEAQMTMLRADLARGPNDQNQENLRPLGDAKILARVASRPSMVPRRPLEDRQESESSSPAFPRLPSTSSLMSLDDTPIKIPPISLRRRLATKSMHDLAGAAGYGTSPSRVGGARETVSAVPRSPRPSQLQIVPSPIRTSSCVPRSVSSVALACVPLSPTLRGPSQPGPPARSSTAPPALPPPPPVYDNEADMPSPFLKKMDGTRFPSGITKQCMNSGQKSGISASTIAPAPSGNKSSRPSLGTKPTMASRLLAARAQASAGVDEVGRRVTAAAIPRRKSFAS